MRELNFKKRSDLKQIITITLLILAYNVMYSNAQNCAGDPSPSTQTDLRDCMGSPNCTSNDISVLEASLLGSTICQTCTPGATVTFDLIITIEHGTNSDRPSLGVFADLSDGTSTCSIIRCNGPIIKAADTANGDGVQDINFGPVTYVCGTTLTLSDIFVVWTSAGAGNNCPLDCGDRSPKCGLPGGSIVIIPPLMCPSDDNVTIEPTCAGTTTGSITLIGTGGSSPYTYTLGATNNTTGIFTNLGAGTYNVTITDSENCTVTCPYTMTEKICCEFSATCNLDPTPQTIEGCNPTAIPTAEMDFNTIFTNIGITPCGTLTMIHSNATNGTLCPNGLTVTRTYTLFDDLGATPNGTLDTGEEFVTCEEVFTIENDEPSIACSGDLTLECSDPNNGDFIDNWLTLVNATSSCGLQVDITNDYDPDNFSDLCGNTGSQTVTFTATDICNRSAICTADIIIQDTTQPTFDNCNTDDLTFCEGEPIAFEIPTASDNCTTPSVIQTAGPNDGDDTLTPGTYQVCFEADDDCTTPVSCCFNVVVVANPSIELTANPDNLVCQGVDQTITVSATVNAGGCPVSFQGWTGGTGLAYLTDPTAASTVFTAVPAAGDYTLSYEVENECNCIASETITITILENPTASITPQFPTSCGIEPIQFNGNPVTNSDGVAIISTVWSGPGAVYLTDPTIVNPLFNTAAADADIIANGGTFPAYFPLVFTATDANGCSVTDEVEVILFENGQVGVVPNPGNACMGDAPIQMEGVVEVSSSGTIVSTIWTGDIANLSNPNIPNPTFGTSVAGTYNLTYTVTDDNNCQAVAQVTINIYEPPTVAPTSAVVCQGDPLQLFGNAQVNGGVIFGHQWSGDVGPLDSSTVENPNFDTNVPGIYTLMYTAEADYGNNAQSNYQCTSATEEITVEVVANPVTPTISGPILLCANEPIPNLNPGNGSYYFYDGNPNGSGNLLAGPVGNYTPTSEGTYWMVAENTSIDGSVNCQSAASSVSIVQYDPISVQVDDPFCDENSQDITYNLTISGGQPGDVASENYTITASTIGNVGNPSVSPSNPSSGDLVSITLDPATPIGTVISVNIVDGNGCNYSTSFTTTFQCCIAEAGAPFATIDCADEDAVINITDQQTDANYQTYVLLVNSSGIIVDIFLVNGTNTVSIPYDNWDDYGGTGDNYQVFTYSVLIGAEPNPEPTIGQSINSIGTNDEGCFDLSSPTLGQFHVPDPILITCEGLIDNGNEGGISPIYYNTYEICIEGGTLPYSYAWETTGYVRHAIVSTGKIRIIYADNAVWSVSITDAEGCTINNGVGFTNDPNQVGGGNQVLDIYNTVISPATLNGSCQNGTISVFAEGGDGNYTFEWSGPNTWEGPPTSFNGSGSSSNGSGVNNVSTMSGLPIGWYAVTVTDGSGQETIGWYWMQCVRPGRGKIDSNTSTTLTVVQTQAFAAPTNIAFSMEETAKVSLELYNIGGQKVANLFEGTVDGGAIQQVYFEAQGTVSNGIYFIRLITNKGVIKTHKLLIAQ